MDEIYRFYYGPIVIEEKIGVPTEIENAVQSLIEGLMEMKGEGRWPNLEAQESLKVRLKLLIEHALVTPNLLEEWPLALFKSLIAPLAQAGVLKRTDLETLVFPAGKGHGYWGQLAYLEAQENFLANAFMPEVAKILREETPLFIPLPQRRRVKVHYAEGRPPWIESMVQDFFGMKEVPKLLCGKLALAVHLLTPARRPMAVTSDLKSFWANHYPKLRSEYMRRYPRHDWPDNPCESVLKKE